MEFPEIDIKNLPQMPDARERFLSSAIGKMRDVFLEMRNELAKTRAERDAARAERDEANRRLESLAARLCPPLPACEPLTHFAPADTDPDGGVFESNIPTERPAHV